MKQTISIEIEDIHCSKCARKIAVALEYTAGVESSEIDLKEKQATVKIENLIITGSKIKAMIVALGFSAMLL
jgi:copper chaperone CopZ